MKNTIKALKYAFAQMNRPLVYLVIILSLLLCIVPNVLTLLAMDSYMKDTFVVGMINMTALNAVFLPMCCINRYSINNCKYSFSLSFANKLHTVVPAVLSFSASIIIFTFYVILLGVKCGKEVAAAELIAGSVGFALIAMLSSLTGARLRDIIIPFVICFFNGETAIFKVIDLKTFAAAPLPAAVLIAVAVFALSFIVTRWYLNVIWNKKSRYIKLNTGYNYLLQNC